MQYKKLGLLLDKRGLWFSLILCTQEYELLRTSPTFHIATRSGVIIKAQQHLTD
jgi:hypothetical protein